MACEAVPPRTIDHVAYCDAKRRPPNRAPEISEPAPPPIPAERSGGRATELGSATSYTARPNSAPGPELRPGLPLLSPWRQCRRWLVEADDCADRGCAYFFNPRRCACCWARRMRSVTSSLPMLSSRDVAHLSI